MKLKTLALSTLGLFIASIVVYIQDNKQGTSPVEGSYLVRGLNINSINKISIHEGNNEKVSLDRDGQAFTLSSHEGYISDTSKVNDLIYDISSLKIKEDTAITLENGSKNNELFPSSSKIVKIFDNDGVNVLSIVLGKTIRVNQYAMRERDNKVYLLKGIKNISTDYNSYINTKILNSNLSDISRVRLTEKKSGKISEVIKEENSYKFAGKEVKESDVSQLRSNLNNMRFTSFYTPTHEKVTPLKFQKDLEVLTDDKVLLLVSLAKYEEEFFLKINAKLNEVPAQLVIKPNEDKEKLAEVEEVFKSQSKAQKINQRHSTWIYEISKVNYENLLKLF